MSISATQVKELREKTGVGMMECKKALTETSGDMEKAVLWLRERGLSRAEKKSGRVTAEGVVEIYVNEDNNAGVVLELNCETDFVSKNEDFRKFAQDVSAIALKNDAASVEALGALKTKTGETVDVALKNLIAKIGENLNLRRVHVFKCPNGTVAGYSHMGGKIGTMVAIDGAKGAKAVEIGKDIAMHIAASGPRYLDAKDVAPGELEQEKELARKKLMEQNKPKDLVEKIVQGQIVKFYKEVCLLEQAFVKDPNISVKKLLEDNLKDAKITSFCRFQLGEGIEKRQEDFAAEVAAAAKQS